MRGIYIHLPFCAKKCRYCAFVSFAGKQNLTGEYLKAVEKEINLRASVLEKAETLYIGGGTPSSLKAEEINFLLETISRKIKPVRDFAESTFEANPESMDAEKADILKIHGISRISMGLESANDSSLKKLGRLAGINDFENAFSLLRRKGFGNLNIDIISGIPGESEEDFRKTLSKTISFRPEHISLYGLEIHKGTDFSRKGIRPDENLSGKMYELAVGELEKAGYERYEISNFALRGYRSVHNINYWDCGEYAGIGVSAASHIGGKRSVNVKSIEKYLARTAAGKTPVSRSERISPEEKMKEKLILGLRKTDGIELDEDIIIKFKNEIGGLLDKGLLEKNGNRLKIAKEYFYLSNRVFLEFI